MSMSMSFSHSVRQEMQISMRVSLADMFGETAGDIPVYSLHRIKRVLAMNPPKSISPKIVGILIRSVIAANEKYRTDTGNDWYCLTSANLVHAIGLLDARLGVIIGAADAMPSEAPKRAAAAQAALESQRARAVRIVQEWFETNYDDLLYDMDGKIPWPIVLRMRRNLGAWIGNAAAEPFGQDIGDMVLDVARAEGYGGDDAEGAWEFMGGKLLNEKKSRRSR